MKRPSSSDRLLKVSLDAQAEAIEKLRKETIELVEKRAREDSSPFHSRPFDR